MAAAAARPLVSVQTIESDMATDATPTVPLADVMKASIRPDIVTFVHNNISKTAVNPMLSPNAQVTRPQLNPGVPVVPSRVFLVFLAAVLTVQAKVLLETCAEVDACLLLPRSGAAGTGKSMLTRSVMPLPLPSPLLLSLPLSWPAATVSSLSRRCHLSFLMLWRA
ncbi:hypothetical protein GQ457_17G009660 [Hibiscus cannabinus]